MHACISCNFCTYIAINTTIQEVNSQKGYSSLPFHSKEFYASRPIYDFCVDCLLLNVVHVYSHIFFTLQNKWCLVLMTIKRMMLMSPKKQRQLSNIKKYEELLSHAFGTRCYLSLQHCHHNDCVPQS